MTASTPAISAQRRCSSTYPSARRVDLLDGVTCRRRRPRRRAAGARPAAIRESARTPRAAAGSASSSFRFPNAPKTGSPGRPLGLDVRRGPRRMRNAPDRTVVAARANAFLDVARVDDHARRAVEHLVAEREVLGPHLPQRRDATVDDAQSEQPARDARVAFHRVEVARVVLAPEREARDEVVEHEVVQHDDARLAAQLFDDPAVHLRVVADVVESDVRLPHACRAARRRRPRAVRAQAATAPSSRRCRNAPEASGCSRQFAARRRAARARRRCAARALGVVPVAGLSSPRTRERP